MKKYLVNILILFVIIVSFSCLAKGEEVVFTSYYPSAVGDYERLRVGEEDASGDKHFLNMIYDESLGYQLMFLANDVTGYNDKIVFSHTSSSIATDFVIDENGWLGCGTDSPSCPVEVVSAEDSVVRIAVADSSSLTIPALLEVGSVSNYSGTEITDIAIYAGDKDCGVLAEGDVYGVFGQVTSENSGEENVAVYGSAASLTDGGTAIGVYGNVFSQLGGGEAIGVYGYAVADNGTTAYAVKGEAESVPGVKSPTCGGYFSGTNYGVQGVSSGYGGHFTCSSVTTGGARAVYATGGLYVGYFDGAASGSMYGLYVEGTHTGGEFIGTSFGIQAESDNFGGVFTCTASGSGTRAIYATGGEYAGYFNGNVYVNGNVTATSYSDIAEVYNLREENDIELGDVVVVDTDSSNTLRKSTMPYSRNVAGVISGPEQAFIIMGKKENLPNDKPLALAGRVICKVTTENGSIKPGDLLVTSSIPGFAMKAEPIGEINGHSIYPYGCILGKALESFNGDEGEILILVCLE